MAIYTYNILSYGIEQGSISGTQETESDTRVRSTGFIPLNSSPKTATVTALSNTSKICCVNFFGYSNNDLTSVICDLYWYDSPYTFDLSGYSGINYCKIVFKYTDDSNITPNEIATATLAINDLKWEVENNKLTMDGLPFPSEHLMTNPYPPFWWYIDNNRLTTSILPSPINYYMNIPYPPFWWYVDNNKLKSGILPSVAKMGAFYNCINLQTATISKNVKYIGDFAFNDTELTEVTIASDCTYKDTSFPDDCTINTYPD